MRRRVCSLALLAAASLAVPCLAPAQQQQPRQQRRQPSVPPTGRELARRIDAFVAPYVRMRDFRGVVVVARGPRIVARRGYGGAPADGRYLVGSVTKTLTAAAVEQLAERGRLSLDDRLSKFLPQLPWGDSVTVRQLLAHEAGVPDLYGFAEYAAARDSAIALDRLVALVARKPLDFAPGSQSRYSNSGYALLAAVVARASGVRYADYLRASVLAPLGMTHSGDFHDGARVPGLVPGFDPGFPPALLRPAPAGGADWLEGSGSVYSTASDLVAWADAARRDAIVDASALPYPYGWGKRERFGRVVWEQDGRIPQGYASYLAVSRGSDSLTVVVLSDVQSQAASEIGAGVEAIALGRTPKPAALRPSATAASDAATLARFVGRYEVFPGFVLSVRAVRGGLELAGPDGAFLALDQLDATHFFFRPLYVPIAFRVDDAGGPATSLLWAGTQECKRVGGT